MPTPSAAFLQGATAAGGDGAVQPPNESDVLMALGGGNSDVTALATALQTTPQAVGLIVDALVRDGLAEHGPSGLMLTAAGQRALKYSYVAR
jgi:Mn-dependent DtxR family transcriptional regulator